MNKLKVGVFGARRGLTMINVLSNHPDAALVAVCDKYKHLLDEVETLGKEKNIKVALYTDFENFMEHDMDAVVLANYANEHAPYAIRLLNKGINVLSEVLPCETMSQAVELIEAVEKSNKVYAYAENYCYMPRPFEMWRRYENNEIGEVTYAEGEYIHDCSSIMPRITYGDPTHWRNRMHPFFYCTHSLAPILTITNRRPIKVTGIASRPIKEFYELGYLPGIAGLEMVTLDNGAVVKSIHGGLKREPSSINYQVYGTKGSMETQRHGEKNLNVYVESEELCKGELETYIPEKFISPELAEKFPGHNGSDFYSTHFFIQKILGKADGKKYSIDVYRAVDMGICGILAYRSNLAGGIPMDVPNLRDKSQRDQFRNDHACVTPEVAKDQLLPRFNGVEKFPKVQEKEYEKFKKQWVDEIVNKKKNEDKIEDKK